MACLSGGVKARENPSVFHRGAIVGVATIAPMQRLALGLAALLASSSLAQEVGPLTPDAGVPAPRQVERPGPSFVQRNWQGTRLLTRTPFLYEASFVVGAGGLIHSPGVTPVPMTGITVRERSGALSAVLLGIFGNALQTFGAVRIDDVKITEEVYGNTVYRTTTANVTVLKTQEELERDQRELREGLAGLTWLELTVYADGFLGWNRGAAGGSGYELGLGMQVELFALGGLPAVLDVGLQLANVRVPPPAGSGVGGPHLYYASGGVLGRLIVPVTRFAAAHLEWVLNFLSLDYLLEDEATLRAEGRVVSSPLKLGLEVYLTDRVVLRGQAVLGGLGFTDGRLGGFLSAGVRL